MNPRVKKVIPSDNYTLKLFFTNGEIKLYDVSPLLGHGVFAKLQDVNIFKQARITHGTVEWPEEIDICPDTLYEDGKTAG